MQLYIILIKLRPSFPGFPIVPSQSSKKKIEKEMLHLQVGRAEIFRYTLHAFSLFMQFVTFELRTF